MLDDFKEIKKAAQVIKLKVLIPYHIGSADIAPILKAFEKSDIKVIFHEDYGSIK